MDAKKDRRGEAEALELVSAVTKVVACKGKKVVSFDLKKDPPGDDELVKHLLGPTGNLRAPTLRRGKTLLVGYNEDAYQEVLG